MGKLIGGAPKPAAPAATSMADVASIAPAATSEVANRTMAEELAGKKMARTRGGSRMLLSAERLNAQEGLSASSTLGG
jgi:hypothetical protein